MTLEKRVKLLAELNRASTNDECLEAYAWALQTQITEIKDTWENCGAQCYCESIDAAVACDVCKLDKAINRKGVRS